MRLFEAKLRKKQSPSTYFATTSRYKMADAMHYFINERLRLSLGGQIPGHQLDSFVGAQHPVPLRLTTLTATANLSHLFKTVRSDLTPSKVFIAVSEPSICGHHYCSCDSQDSTLQKYKITIFVDRKEQGRTVTKPWLRVTSDVGFEDAVTELMRISSDLVAEKENKKKLLETERFEIRTRKSATCLVEVFEAEMGRARGFTLPSKGSPHWGTM